jgi:hypothetical protein
MPHDMRLRISMQQKQWRSITTVPQSEISTSNRNLVQAKSFEERHLLAPVMGINLGLRNYQLSCREQSKESK